MSDEPVRTNTTELKLAEFGRKKTEFALSLKSDYKKRGTVVIDRTVAESRARPDHEVVYTVAANGTLLHESTRNVMNRVNYFWLILLGILALPPIALLIQHMKNRGKIGK